MSIRVLVRRGAAALVVAASPAACVGSGDIDGRDRGVISPAAHFEWQLHEPKPESPKRVQGDLDLELRASHASAHGELELDPGEEIAFSDTAFTGPAAIDLDWTVDAASLAFRGGFSARERFGLQGIVGLGGQRVGIHLANLTDEVTSYGTLFGAEIHGRPLDRLELYARYTILLGLFGEHTSFLTAMTEEAEAGVRLRVTDALGLFGSWRWWTLRQEREPYSSDDEFSDYRLRLTGPMVGVYCWF
jgi:hypothetical protein